MDISRSSAPARSLLSASRDRRNLLAPDAFWTGTARAATVGIFLLLATGFLDLARTLLLPIVSAFVFAAMLGPFQAYAARHRVPAWLFALAAVGAIVAAINFIIILAAAPLVEWLGRAPDIAASLRDKLEILGRPFSALRDLQHALSPGRDDVAMKIEVSTLVQPILAFLTPAIGELLVFLASLFFFLMGRNHLRRHLVLFFGSQETRLRALRILSDIEDNLTRYMATAGAINVGVGVIVALASYLIGLPNAAMWGAVAFALNFLPYIGPMIMAATLFMAGLVVFPSLGHALIAPGFFVVLATLEGHFVTPNIVGRQLTLSPLLIFLALAFWTWLWGPVGAFLATPLLIAGMVGLNHMIPNGEIELPA